MARRRIDDLEMERAFEERVEGKRPRGSGRKKSSPPAPLLLRVMAWLGVIALCFVAGYIGTEYMVKKIFDQAWPGSLPASGDVTVQAGGVPDMAAGLDMQKATFSVYYPRDGELVSEQIDVISRTLEDNIREAVLRILKLSELGNAADVLHVFIDMETIYLDFSGQFAPALTQAGKDLATLLVTGIVRTVNENFSMTRVRFLVESKTINTGSGLPVDLSVAWQVQR